MFNCLDNGPRLRTWIVVIVVLLMVIVFAAVSMPRPFGELLLAFSMTAALIGGVLGLLLNLRQQNRGGRLALT